MYNHSRQNYEYFLEIRVEEKRKCELFISLPDDVDSRQKTYSLAERFRSKIRYPFYFYADVSGTLFECFSGSVSYVSSFEVEGKLDALALHLVTRLAIPLLMVGPLLLD